ncbi:MAG: 16S rRNA (guanine(527)-N(7))-methyltransferase RsmG [Firmicutes bacterium]|jgi:16S rRNA (guanine527-N7)-methyltransferase|nr:16S rRNA (guanine(527)-N(7))-methyltransferase RsmG [Bacillota bacterium]
MNLGREVREKALSMGIEISPEAEVLFEKHAALLEEWNQKLNLTRIPKEEMADKHFLDSLSVLLVPEVEKAGKVVDIGSGAGFPGIPLKIVCPDMQMTLVDSLGKRIKFLQAVVGNLGLKDVTCHHARAEELGQDSRHRERYDAALARAVAALPVLCEYLLPLVRVGGVAVAMKGPGGKQEVEEAARALKVLGGEAADVVEFNLPSGDERQLIVIKKVKPTPREYPRRPGTPQKDPLV